MSILSVFPIGSVSGGSSSVTGVGPVLKVATSPATAGLEVTATQGDRRIAGITDENGQVALQVDALGDWTVSAVVEADTFTSDVHVPEEYTTDLSVSKLLIFGVCWNYGNPSTALTRLTKTNDPNGYVNVDITTEPIPAVGTGFGSSPFDDYAPWSDMEEYNIIDSVVKYKRGEPGFSRENYDTMVYIPEFYFKIVNDSANKKRYFYVADNVAPEFTKHPGSGRFVGRYDTTLENYSKAGGIPTTQITRADARSKARAKGEKWYLYDYASWCAIWLLYLVEFADWDSQAKIGIGYVYNSFAKIISGETDGMTYHTGQTDGDVGHSVVQYRHIEHPWGNVTQLVDGINFNNRVAYICTDPNKYADDTETNYDSAGITLAYSSLIKNIGVSITFPWAFLPNIGGGSEKNYIPDYVNSGDGWCVMTVGGKSSNISQNGMFFIDATGSSRTYLGFIGARLLFIP